MGGPAREILARDAAQGQGWLIGLNGPRNRSFLAKGSPGSPATGLRRWGGESNRIGVRAFFSKKGYAGRNWRNGVGFACAALVVRAGKRTATVPVLV
jgi:hypothetical protein